MKLQTQRTADVALGFLKPNPFRADIGPLLEEDIAEIKESIEKFNWWGGLRGRRLKDGTIELAIGHRRHAAALQMLGPTQVVKVVIDDYTDSDMLEMMCKENSHRHCSPEERVYIIRLVVKELNKNRPESAGVCSGAHISRFMGEKAWPERQVQKILEQIKAQDSKKSETESIDPFVVKESGQPLNECINQQEIRPVTPAVAKTLAEAEKLEAEVESFGIQTDVKDEAKSVEKQPKSKPAKTEAIRLKESLIRVFRLFKALGAEQIKRLMMEALEEAGIH